MLYYLAEKCSGPTNADSVDLRAPFDSVLRERELATISIDHCLLKLIILLQQNTVQQCRLEATSILFYEIS